MANIFRIWGKKANTKEQMMPEEIVGQELADEQLEAVIGGCDQPSNQRSYQPQSYGDHHHRHRHPTIIALLRISGNPILDRIGGNPILDSANTL